MVTLLTLLNSMLHVHFSILVHMYLNNTLKSGYLITSDNSGAEIGEMGLFLAETLCMYLLCYSSPLGNILKNQEA